MKRICLLGAAIAGVLILGVTTALAASPHASKSKTSKSAPGTKLTCASALTLQVPANDTTVTADEQSGAEGGAAVCRKPLGKGAEFQSFTTQGSGDITGKWQQWFNTGSLYGTYALTPQSTPPTSSSTFAAASYTGTFVIKGGTGTDAKSTGPGTLACATQDSVHYVCAEKGRLIQPAAKKS